MTKLKSIPLNSTYREQIVKNIMSASPEKEAFDKHAEKGPALALKLSDHIIGPRHKKAYRSLPFGMLNGIISVKIEVEGRDCARIDMPEGTCHHSYWMKLDDAPASLKKQFSAWLDKRKMLDDAFVASKKKVKALLSGILNTKQLLEEIPDAFQFFPDELKHKCQGGALPAVPAQAVRDVQQIVAASAKNLEKDAA